MKTRKSSTSVSSSIVERTAVSRLSGVYWLGGFVSQVTFYAQQRRAFNLVWALFEEGLLKPKKRVAIVGGGLAGMTAAVAAARKGCRVTLFEKAGEFMHLQRGNRTRFIHPNVYDWPQRGAAVPYTKLPYLNWTAEYADKVVEQIDPQWEQLSEDIEPLKKYRVENIRSYDGKTTVTANGKPFHEKEYDCVILAVGFGLEKRLAPVRFRSYWQTDDLHQPVIDGPYPKRWLVTGCGDGGLIDVLRLCLKNFDHANLVSSMLSDPKLVPVKRRLLAIEAEARELYQRESKALEGQPEEKINAYLEERVGTYIFQQYKKLKIPASVRKNLKSRLREDTLVTLNSPSASPMSLKSAILNRFAVSLLLRYTNLSYAQGKLDRPVVTENGYRVTFLTDNQDAKSDDFNDIVVRHGPAPLIGQLLSEEDIRVSKRTSLGKADPTQKICWSMDSFPEVKLRKPTPKSRLEQAVQNLQLAIKELHDRSHVYSVGIGPDKKKPVYVVTLKPGVKQTDIVKKSTVSGIPVIYLENERAAVEAVPVIKSKKEAEPLVCGMAITNYDVDLRAGDVRSGFRGEGTLGCFVRLATGETALLSSNNVIGGENTGVIGDRIIRAGDYDSDHLQPVGLLHSFVSLYASLSGSTPAGGDVFFNEVDAAIATLAPDIKYLPGFDSKYRLPKFKGTGTAGLGDVVFKVGRTTGLTFGRITGVGAVLGPVIYRTGESWFKQAFEIEGLAGTPFSVAGDSGAVVVREDGTVLGIIFAGNGTLSFACSIDKAMNALKCRLVVE